jgi:hypothetical protein
MILLICSWDLDGSAYDNELKGKVLTGAFQPGEHRRPVRPVSSDLCLVEHSGLVCQLVR